MSGESILLPTAREFLLELAERSGAAALARALEAGARALADGLTPPAQALLAVWLHRLTRRPIILIVADNAAAEERCRELAFFQALTHASGEEEPPLVLPAFEHDPYEGLAPHEEILQQQALALWRAASGAAGLMVVPAAAMLLRLEPLERYRALGRQIQRGERLEPEQLIEHLRRTGYRAAELVEMPGQYARRGGLVDVYSPEAEGPLRVEFFGDEIESLRQFDTATQRSTQTLEAATLAPLAAYAAVDHAAEGLSVGWAFLLPESAARRHSTLDLSPRALALVAEPEMVEAEWRRWQERLERRHAQASASARASGAPAPPTPGELFHAPEEVREWLSLCAGAELRELRMETNPDDHSAHELEAERLLLRTAAEGGAGKMDSVERGPGAGEPKSTRTAGGVMALSAPRFSFATRPAPRLVGGIERLMDDLRRRLEKDQRMLLVTSNLGELERLSDLLLENHLPFELGMRPEAGAEWLAEKAQRRATGRAPLLVAGGLEQGLEWRPPQPPGKAVSAAREACFTILGSANLLSRPESAPAPPPRRAAPRSRLGAFLGDFRDLKPGDYVVHADHGIARYQGLVSAGAGTAAAAGAEAGEFMLLEYAEGAKLYLPLTRMDRVQKYRSGDGAQPPLDRLGGTQWTQRKSRVKRAMQDMTDELLKLYAARQTVQIEPCGADSHWQREFEDAFPYVLTEDQERAIEDVRRDLQSARPMDRLLVGDVGYGKTEVAMRAAFKLVSEGRQAAVLAPTTVLAFQHFETFRNRFAAFPLRIEMLSRFRTRTEQAAVLAALAAGELDIVIGTHRLLSQDVRFRRLGLLVVDEEQRFGVRHKERLKQLKQEVHVLALSATPIPRTLNMSLAGLRDLSVIETPPKDRLAIQTVVAGWSDELVRQALETELGRGGQVFYVHNRVDTIWQTAARLQELAPGARIVVVHGQMDGVRGRAELPAGEDGAAPRRRLASRAAAARKDGAGGGQPGQRAKPASEAELERVMLSFIRHQADILVSTSIIENGLDIPLANTILIERADLFGLSELYQLRGRVGRSNRRAYAYLLAPPLSELSPLARKRLAAMREFSDLGAGFKIAALDLELRGAGNLLGAEQSGHIETVGFDMYLRMLEQTVRERKGEAPERGDEFQVQIQLGAEIGIPENYIAEETQRLRMYKRIAEAEDEATREDVERELADRFGPPPPPVRHLLAYAAIKSACLKLGIRALERRREQLVLHFVADAGTGLDRTKLAALVARTRGAQLSPQGVLKLPFRSESAAAALGAVLALLARLESVPVRQASPA